MEIPNMKGQTATYIEGCERDSEEIIFHLQNGKTFVMRHEQDCCEYVAVEDVTGDIADLVNAEILSFDEESNSENCPSEGAESWTWTFYKITTVKGSVTIRWLGQSNGYYSESVSCFIREH